MSNGAEHASWAGSDAAALMPTTSLPESMQVSTCTVYLNNAATTYPKPPGVLSRVAGSLTEPPGDPLPECRRRLASLLGAPDPDRIALTPGATASINYALHAAASLHAGRFHCLTSVLEHDSVLRPLRHLARRGLIDLDWLSVEEVLSPIAVERRFRRETRLVVLTAASHVTGVQPAITSIGRLCDRHDVVLVVDAAQAVGSIPIRVTELPARSLLALAGHTGLYRPQGPGALPLGEGFTPQDLVPLIQGGTGLEAEDDFHPSELPQLFEPGTGNLPGFAGLAAGIEFVLRLGVERIGRRKSELISGLVHELRGIAGLRLYLPSRPDYAAGMLAFNLDRWPPSEASRVLQETYGIVTRGGIHCAPLYHRALGIPDGSVRASVGWWTTEADLQKLIGALRGMARGRA
jgi:selenocysteine lyase/cysteine desulfurase